MSPRSFAAVLVAVLMVATVFSVALGASLPARSPSPAVAAALPRPASTFTFELFDGYGNPASTFYPGAYETGTLYYEVYDSTTTDKDVNVTLTDPNATRDGVANPAYHYEAPLNSATHGFNSYLANESYVFPGSIPYDGEWTLNFSESSTDYLDVTVDVVVYSVELTTSVSGSILPGESYTIFWNLTSESNGASFYTHATNVVLEGAYYGNETLQPLFTHPRDIQLTGANAGYGSYTGVVPDNATPLEDLYFNVWAYAEVGGVEIENASSATDFAVGELYIEGTSLTAAPPYCDLYHVTTFGTGTTLAGCIAVYSWYYGDFTPAAGLPVTIGYWNGTDAVKPAGAPTALTTNASGEAAFTFLADSPPFAVSTHTDIFNGLNYTVHVPGADTTGYRWSYYQNLSWVLVAPTPQIGFVNVSLDKTQYFAGQTATVTWSIHSSDLNLTGPIDPISWTLFTYEGTLSVTAIGGTAQSGTFSIPITAAMVSAGVIVVMVTAANNTTSFEGDAVADVLAPEVLLTPSTTYYTAGSSPSVTAVLEGATGATIDYLVVGYWSSIGDVNITSGTVASGSSFSIPVPSAHPPNNLYIYAWATINGTSFGTTETEMALAFGYSVQLGVSTPSSYADGSYQPGQTVTLSYAIVPVGGAPTPAIVSFVLVTLGYPTIHDIQNVGPSGTVSFTIPSSAPRGTLIVEMEVETELGGDCLPTGSCMGIAALPINPSPSVLSLELGAGSGVTVGWLIVLVLVLAVGAVGAVLFLRGRARRRSGGSSGSGSSPPPEWKSSSSPSSPSAGGTPPAGPPPGAA
jgi:hypothetical protein